MFLLLFKIESSAPCRGGAGLRAPLPFIMQQLTQKAKAAHAARAQSRGRLPAVSPPAAPALGPAAALAAAPTEPRARSAGREAPPAPAERRGRGAGRCRAPLAAAAAGRERCGGSAMSAPGGPRPCRVLHLVPGPASRPSGAAAAAAAAAAVFTERSCPDITPLARRRRRWRRRAFDHCDGGRRSSSQHDRAKR